MILPARPPVAVDDLDQLADGAIELIVDHDVVGHRQPDRLLFDRLAQALLDLVLGVAALAQPALLLLPRRREDEDQDCVDALALDLGRAVDLDLQHHVARRWRVGGGVP